MKKLLLISLLVSGARLWGQNPTITPQVINSTGSHRQVGSSGIYITDNVGEPFTETLGASGGNMITQGYLQPEIVTIGGFSIVPQVKNVTCLDKQDGEILLRITRPPQVSNYQVTYSWTPGNTCTANCDSLVNLNGNVTYTVSATITYTDNIGVVKTTTMSSAIKVEGSNELCKIKIYNGVTPNDDGVNDVFTIENIEEFPRNHLMIYNRWGSKLADLEHYNNTSISWPPKDKLDNLVASTYFYILDLGDGSKPIKGWLELIKN
jgi:gliding motility-associated-like protein